MTKLTFLVIVGSWALGVLQGMLARRFGRQLLGMLLRAVPLAAVVLMGCSADGLSLPLPEEAAPAVVAAAVTSSTCSASMLEDGAPMATRASCAATENADGSIAIAIPRLLRATLPYSDEPSVIEYVDVNDLLTVTLSTGKCSSWLPVATVQWTGRKPAWRVTVRAQCAIGAEFKAELAAL